MAVAESSYIIAALAAAVGIVGADVYIARSARCGRLPDCATPAARAATTAPAILSVLALVGAVVFAAVNSSDGGACVLAMYFMTAFFPIWTVGVFGLSVGGTPPHTPLGDDRLDGEDDEDSDGRGGSGDVEEGTGRRRVVVGTPPPLLRPPTSVDNPDDAAGAHGPRDVELQPLSHSPDADHDPPPVLIMLDDERPFVPPARASSSPSPSPSAISDTATSDAASSGPDAASSAVGAPKPPPPSPRPTVWPLAAAVLAAHFIVCVLARGVPTTPAAELGECAVMRLEALVLAPIVVAYASVCVAALSRALTREDGGVSLWAARGGAAMMLFFNLTFLLALADGDFGRDNLDALLRTYSVVGPVAMQVVWVLPYALWRAGLAAQGLRMDAKHRRHRRRRQRAARRAADPALDGAVRHARGLTEHQRLELVVRAHAAQAYGGGSAPLPPPGAVVPVAVLAPVGDGREGAGALGDGREGAGALGDGRESAGALGAPRQAHAKWGTMVRDEAALRFLRDYCVGARTEEMVDFLVLTSVYFAAADELDMAEIEYVHARYVAADGAEALNLNAETRAAVGVQVARMRIDAAEGVVSWRGAGPFQAAADEVARQLEAGVIPGFLVSPAHDRYMAGALPPPPAIGRTSPSAPRDFFRVPPRFRAAAAASQVRMARIFNGRRPFTK